MLNETFEAVIPAMQASTEAVTEAVSGSFFPPLINLRDACSYGIERGVQNLTQIGVVVGGVVVIGAASYGVYKCAEYVSDVSYDVAHSVRNRAASWVTPKEGTVKEAEVVVETATAAA